MISKLYLKNFKRFKEIEIPFKSLTLLAGLNGMGKSTLIQSILVLKQSEISGSLADGFLDLSGELIELGRGKDVLFEGSEEDTIVIGISQVNKNRQQEQIFSFSYTESLDQLPCDIRNMDQSAPVLEGGFQYLCAERLGPRKSLPLSESKVRNRNIGKMGEYVFHALLSFGTEILDENDSRVLQSATRSIRFQANAWLQEISPGVQLDITPVSAIDTAIGSYAYEQPGDITSFGYRPNNVGFGISYVLPVIVACLLSKPGDILIVENPEAHIHPHGQTRIGELLAYTAKNGVQVIIETHSEHVMNGIRVSVKEKRISSDTVAFHYIEKHQNTAKIISPNIDTNGRLSLWPDGFFDEHEENLAKLIT